MMFQFDFSLFWLLAFRYGLFMELEDRYHNNNWQFYWSIIKRLNVGSQDKIFKRTIRGTMNRSMDIIWPILYSLHKNKASSYRAANTISSFKNTRQPTCHQPPKLEYVLINYTDVSILVRPSKYAYESCPNWYVLLLEK